MGASARRSADGPPAPVILIGAARSGTKLLRSIVAAADEFSEVPHDVNYIWRYGDPRCPHDELSPSTITPRVKRFIRGQLRRMAGLPRQAGGRTFVEKTVSNTLRVPYVDAVLPDARFIHLVRDGLRVTESAVRCWQAPPEPGRLLSKLRDFPWLSCGGYALGQARDWAERYLSGKRQLRYWGPRYPGIEADIATKSLAVVGARQWHACVVAARNGLNQLPSERWIEVRYEDLANNPEETGRRLGEFLDVSQPAQISERAACKVLPIPPRSLDETLSPSELAEIHELVASIQRDPVSSCVAAA